MTEDGLVGTRMDSAKGTEVEAQVVYTTPSIPKLWPVMDWVLSLLPFMLILFDCACITEQYSL